MTHKKRLIFSLSSMVLVLAIGVVGIFAATSATVETTSTLSFTSQLYSDMYLVGITKYTNGTGAAVKVDGTNNSKKWAQDYSTTATTASHTMSPNPTFAGVGETNRITYDFYLINKSQSHPGYFAFYCKPTTASNIKVKVEYYLYTFIYTCDSYGIISSTADYWTDENFAPSLKTGESGAFRTIVYATASTSSAISSMKFASAASTTQDPKCQLPVTESVSSTTVACTGIRVLISMYADNAGWNASGAFPFKFGLSKTNSYAITS